MSKEFKQPITEEEQQKAHDVIKNVKKKLKRAAITLLVVAGFAVCALNPIHTGRADQPEYTISEEAKDKENPNQTPDKTSETQQEEQQVQQEKAVHYDDEQINFSKKIGCTLMSVETDNNNMCTIVVKTDAGKDLTLYTQLQEGNGRTQTINKSNIGKHFYINPEGSGYLSDANSLIDAIDDQFKKEAGSFIKRAQEGHYNFSEECLNELDDLHQNGVKGLDKKVDQKYVNKIDVSNVLSSYNHMQVIDKDGRASVGIDIELDETDAKVRDYQSGTLEGKENITDKAEREAQEANKAVTDEETNKQEDKKDQEVSKQEQQETNKEDKKTEEENKKQVEEDTGKKNDDTEVVKPTKPAPPGPSDTKKDKDESKGKESKGEETKAPEKPSEEKSSQVAEEGETSEEKKQNIEESLDFDDFFNDASDAAAPGAEQESAENTVEDVADDFAE